MVCLHFSENRLPMATFGLSVFVGKHRSLPICCLQMIASCFSKEIPSRPISLKKCYLTILEVQVSWSTHISALYCLVLVVPKMPERRFVACYSCRRKLSRLNILDFLRRRGEWSMISSNHWVLVLGREWLTRVIRIYHRLQKRYKLNRWPKATNIQYGCF